MRPVTLTYSCSHSIILHKEKLGATLSHLVFFKNDQEPKFLVQRPRRQKTKFLPLPEEDEPARTADISASQIVREVEGKQVVESFEVERRARGPPL